MLMMCVSISGGCPSRLRAGAEDINNRTRVTLQKAIDEGVLVAARDAAQESQLIAESWLGRVVEVFFNGPGGPRGSAQVPVPYDGNPGVWKTRVYNAARAFLVKRWVPFRVVGCDGAPARGQNHVAYSLVHSFKITPMPYGLNEQKTLIHFAGINSHYALMDISHNNFEEMFNAVHYYPGLRIIKFSEDENKKFIDDKDAVFLEVRAENFDVLEKLLEEVWCLACDLDNMTDSDQIQETMKDFIRQHVRHMRPFIWYFPPVGDLMTGRLDTEEYLALGGE